MLAKPEYFSPPDEVCCWPERCGEAAGTGAAAELLTGQGATAELLTNQGAFAGCLLAEALWRKSIGKTMLEGAPMRRAIGNKLLARKRAASGRILSNQWCAIIASLLYLCRQEASGRRACSAWKNCRAQKCLQCLERLQGSESLWQRVVAHLFCVQQMNLEWEE